MKLHQQGDVLFKETKIPKDAKPLPGLVLVRSAVTSHTHLAVGEVQKLEAGGKIYLRASKDFDVVHEEHKTLTIPAGEYWVDAVQEYDHFLEEARAVAD